MKQIFSCIKRHHRYLKWLASAKCPLMHHGIPQMTHDHTLNHYRTLHPFLRHLDIVLENRVASVGKRENGYGGDGECVSERERRNEIEVK